MAWTIETLTIGFDEIEDRIVWKCVLRGREEPVWLHFTRRITDRAIARICAALADQPGRSPQAEAPARQQEMAAAHVRAVSQASRHTTRSEDPVVPAPGSPPPELVVQMGFRLRLQGGARIRIQTRAGGATDYALVLNRSQLHWLLDRHSAIATHQGWQLQADCRWLTRPLELLEGGSSLVH